MARTLVGADVLVDTSYAALSGLSRVGVIANPTSLLPATAEHLVDRMASDSKAGLLDLCCVFGPEHGFRGDQQDGHGERTYNDSRTGLPVYNTYGVSGDDLRALLASSGAQALVFDIQDVGARFYTFIWTLYDMMVAAASLRDGFPVVVLDRPNPLGGAVRGPMLHPGFESFVGRAPIAMSHGMTVAELGALFAGKFIRAAAGGASVAVSAVPMRRWRRAQGWASTGLPWVLPSPNMPTHDTARAYAGLCLLEGTTLSEGRGTTRPFQVVGAPFLDWRFAAALRTGPTAKAALWREAWFTPTFSKHAGNLSAGVDLLLDGAADAFDPVRAALEVLAAARAYKGFGWLGSIDRLTGSNYTRLALDGGASVEQLLQHYAQDVADAGFAQTRARYVISAYDDP